MTSRPTPTAGYKSKTLATWIALVGGMLGLHRFYLYGLKDRWGWLCIVPTAFGAWGLERVQAFGQDDQAAWILVPLLGLVLAGTMLTAIVYGLMPDEKWNARFNPDGPAHHSGWSTVIGVGIALFVGAGVLMATLAFSGPRYFEYQVEEARKISQ
jgi:hypothetical protein